MDGMPGEESSRAQLSHEQKIGVGMLLIFAVICIALGVIQIRNRLYAPFALSNKVPSIYKDEINSPEALRYRDTDNDGINDFDEVYQYSTSPYLSDSDSDGIPDKEEIEKGGDPTCAKGKKCVGPIESGEDDPTHLGGAGTTTDAMPILNADTLQNDMMQTLNDPKELRKMMIQAGLKKETADKMSDQDILALVAQTLASTTPEQLTKPN